MRLSARCVVDDHCRCDALAAEQDKDARANCSAERAWRESKTKSTQLIEDVVDKRVDA